LPHIVALYRDQKGMQQAVITAKALFCGVCEPREDPVAMPELR
jgi:aerobic-type carbon monoxide dehydrogenase small subunit (CoxS/CutS family)